MATKSTAADALFVTLGGLAGALLGITFILIGYTIAGGFGAH